jgi:tetratricopeptide (TPR) repeat protein
MAIQNAKDPDSRLKAIDDLLTNFADTDFKSQVLDMAVDTARMKNDPSAVAAWADRALQNNPKDYIAQADLASALASQMKEFDLNLKDEASKVQQNAQGAIDNVKDAPKPNPSMTDAQWEAAKKEIAAQAYEAWGMSDMVQKNYKDAIQQFSHAISMSPNSVLRVRLGQAYVNDKQYDAAIAQYELAMSDPNAPVQVKQIAQAGKVQALKLKGGPAAPPAATPAPAPASAPPKQ